MTAEKLLGQQLGPYRIEAILGSGGMAVVYRAGRAGAEPVALKVLFPPPGAAAVMRARFEREARTAARLRHPGIVRVLDAGQGDGYTYLAMSLVAGQTLADRLLAAEARPLGEELAADIAWQMADALYYAHGQGVVHRDVKPSNILLTPAGQALLTDFGVAQALDDPALTRTGQTVGTPAYMAPEQASGEQPLDGRADLYSLGVVLYQMVAGRPPFQGPTPRVLHAHMFEPPPLPSSLAPVSPGMEAVIMRALAKEPSARFQTGAAMAQALAALGDQTGTRIDLPQLGQARSSRRPRLLWLGLIPLVLALAIGLWQFSESGSETPTPAAMVSPAPTFTEVFTILPTSTASPWPSPTPTEPPPTPTPSPPPTLTSTPTASPAPAPVDTATPLPPTPTPCPKPIDPALAPLRADSALSDRLGCPEGVASTVAAAWQPFERGLMLWRSDLLLIHILGPDQTWSTTEDLWKNGDLAFDAAIVAPDGLYQPVQGFGKVWRDEPGVRETVGWGAAEEAGFEAVLQRFTGGLAWFNPEDETFFILFNDGSYTHSLN